MFHLHSRALREDTASLFTSQRRGTMPEDGPAWRRASRVFNTNDGCIAVTQRTDGSLRIRRMREKWPEVASTSSAGSPRTESAKTDLGPQSKARQAAHRVSAQPHDLCDARLDHNTPRSSGRPGGILRGPFGFRQTVILGPTGCDWGCADRVPRSRDSGGSKGGTSEVRAKNSGEGETGRLLSLKGKTRPGLMQRRRLTRPSRESPYKSTTMNTFTGTFLRYIFGWARISP